MSLFGGGRKDWGRFFGTDFTDYADFSVWGDGGKGGGSVGGGLSLKVLRKHIKRLVNYAEAGDGGKIREELKRVVPEYKPNGS